MATEAEIIASNILASAIEYKRLYDTTKKNEYKVKEQRLRQIAENIKLIVSSTSSSSVSSFNGRTGAVILSSADVTGALGYTPGDMLKSIYDYDNDGVVDSAERTEIIVRNSTGSTLTKGTVVYLSGATGNRPNALRAQANSEATSSKTFGFVVSDIADNSDGYVACAGTLHDLDTSAFADGVALWLSPSVAGGWTTTVPSEPNHSVFLGYVARSHPTQGRVVILIQNGYELNELHDVVISSPSNGQILRYNSTNAYWENWTPTYLTAVPTLDQVTTAGYTTTNPIIAGQYQIYGTTRNARLTSDNVGGFDINYNIGGTPDWRWFGGGTTALTTFKANGNVLIGTTTDNGQKLQVNGTSRLGGNTSVLGTTEDASNTASLTIQTTNTSLRLGGNTTYSWIQSHSSKPLYINELGNNIILNLSAGSVGIGTASPSAKLHVADTMQLGTTSNASFSFRLTRTSGAVPQDAHFYAPTNNSPAVFYIEGGYYTGEAVGTSTAALSGYPYYEKYFGNGSTLSYKHLGFINVANGSFGNTNLIPSIALLSTGNVGIGTTNPSYRLDVQGTTTAHAISTQVGLNFNPVASPTTGSLALVASAGNVDLGTHYYFVTFTTALGETNPYQIGNITTTAGNQQVTVTIPISTDPRVTGRKLYRTKATGQSYETFNLATIANNTATSYVDNIADASLTGTSGTGFYQVNTTHRAITLNGVQSLVIDTFATYLGLNAGGGVTSGGGNNTFIGYNAGRYSYTANQSVAIGNSALSAQTAGGNNIGIGSQAGGFTVGSDNIAIGRNAAVNINTGSSNTIVGSFTWNLGAVTGKTGNTGLGYNVGSSNTGNYNLFLGYQAGYYVTGSNQILLDTVGRANEATAKSSALIYGVTSATASSQILSLGGGGNVGIGTLSPTYRLDVQGTTLAASSVRVQGSFDINPLAAPPVIGGYTLSAGTNLGVGTYYYFVTYVTALGETNAGSILTVTTTTGNTTVNLTGIPVSSDPRVTARKIYRTLVGQTSDAQRFLATINDNVTTTYTDSATDASLTGVALQYYKVNTTARYFTVSGVQGMVIDSNLTALGRNAGNAIIASSGAAIRTVLIGADAGKSITTGQANVIVGVAGVNLTTGSNNTLVGDLAGYNLTTGSGNTIIGGNEPGRFLLAATENVIIGAQAARNLADGTTQVTGGTNNTVVGVKARMSTISDTNAIIIGHTALGLGTNTTVIGNSSTTFTSIPAGNMTIGGTTNAGYKLDVNGTARIQSSLTVDTDTLFVDATNNRVGIGTTTPGDKLSIVDASNANIFGRITANGTNASAAWVAMNNQNDNVVYRVFGDGVSGSQMGISLVRSASLMANLGGSGKFLLGTYSATDFVMGTGNAEKVRIVDSTGNFLIGTTSDNGNKLQVNGTIDGQAFALNGVNGWTGTIMIAGNPPGMQNIDVQSGIIMNVF